MTDNDTLDLFDDPDFFNEMDREEWKEATEAPRTITGVIESYKGRRYEDEEMNNNLIELNFVQLDSGKVIDAIDQSAGYEGGHDDEEDFREEGFWAELHRKGFED
mgnify:CR=1 FL=1|tara:strand:+ start:1389 stop:1703 length:315 start_codon:yes stop_codon:yes gene_type:complete